MRSENIEIEYLPQNRSDAAKIGSLFYYTGKPCKNGHVAPRYTSTGQCVNCQEVHYHRKSPHRPRPTKDEYLKKAQEIATIRGGRCLSKKYVSAKSLLTISCRNSDHSPFKISYDNLKRGRWCPHCKYDRMRGNYQYDIEDMHRIAEEKGGKCLSKKFLGVKKKIKWSCGKQNHSIFLATPDNVIQGKWCPQCGEEKKGRELRPIEDVLELIRERGGTLINFIGDYRGYETRVKIRCADGHRWSPTVHSLLKGSWCPECLDSVGEIITRIIFEATYGIPFPKTKPEFLRSKKGGCLELDGYNKDKKIAFEYQGPYHQNADQIERDNEKRELCIKEGVTVIEIPYVVNPYPAENVLKAVRKVIYKIEPHRKVILPDGDYYSKKLDELRRLARSRGGELLSTVYLGSKTKLLWSCGKPGHPTWKAQPQSIKRGSWCNICSTEFASKKKASFYFEKLKAFGEEVGLTLISNEYKGVKESYQWKCGEEHIIKRTKAHILESLKRNLNPCTVCKGTSKKK